MTFFANSDLILQISHTKTFKIRYTRCQYNNPIVYSRIKEIQDRNSFILVLSYMSLNLSKFSISHIFYGHYADLDTSKVSYGAFQSP